MRQLQPENYRKCIVLNYLTESIYLTASWFIRNIRPRLGDVGFELEACPVLQFLPNEMPPQSLEASATRFKIE